MWAAVLVAVVASAGNNIGKVLQKQATNSLPRLSLDNKVLKAYLRNALWLTGLLVDLLGAVLMLEAVAHAPVSVVQPVSGCGMAVMAVFSHAYLKEPMTTRDWLGVSLAAVGTLGVGFCAEGPKDQATEQQQVSQQQDASEQLQRLQAPQQPQISPGGLLIFLILLGILLLSSETWLATRSKSKRRHGQRDAPLSSGNKAEVTDEVVAGCQAGCCFGFSAATVKTGFLLSSAAAALNSQRQKILAAAATAGSVASGAAAGGGGSATGAAALAAAASKSSWLARGGALWGLAGIGAGISLSSAGFFCQTRGFKEGRAVVVSTCAAVSSILTAVIGGMVALGEKLPVDGTLRFVLFCSWLLILAGICLLVGDKTISPTFDTLRPPPLRQGYGQRKLSGGSRYASQSLSPPSNMRKHEP